MGFTLFRHHSGKTRIKFITSVLAILGISLGCFYGSLCLWSKQKIELQGARILNVPKGVKLHALAEKLAAEGLIDGPTKFSFWVKLNDNFRQFQAGQYRFDRNVSPNEIITKIVSGKSYTPLVLEFNIPEGFTCDQIIKRLAKLKIGSEQVIKSLTRNKKFINELGVKAVSLEGYLYPATYKFYTFPTPNEVISKMVAEFMIRIPDNYHEKIKSRGLTLHQAVTFASLIEKETAIESEKELISEVIWNRLKARIPLGIDASIIYGISNYKGNLTTLHLKSKTNKYNTRIYRGLPPGPIASPSSSSLAAVVNPTQYGNFYYVLLSGQNKKHHFSKTLKEHNLFVRKLVKSQTSQSR